jgi:enoyl-CoA hydratase
MTEPTHELTRYELDGAIASIAIDDGKLNVFSIAMLQALHAALDRAEQDGAVVLLRGRPGCFSAGFDMNVFGAGLEPTLEMLTLGATLAERVLSFPRPVLVACSGHAVAAGAFLPLAADVRIGADGPFRIGLNEVKIGLTVPSFAIELARGRLTPAHFDAAVVGARMYDPAGAVTAGFLDRVVDADELGQASLAAAAELAELNGAAHAATKRRARAETLARLRAAIEGELTAANLAALAA